MVIRRSPTHPPTHPIQIQPGYVGIDGRRREKFVVIDARPELSARANQAARGMGFENTPQYKQVEWVGGWVGCSFLFLLSFFFHPPF